MINGWQRVAVVYATWQVSWAGFFLGTGKYDSAATSVALAAVAIWLYSREQQRKEKHDGPDTGV